MALSPSSFFTRRKKDILARKLLRVFAHIVQKIGYIVFITENGTVFKVSDFGFFFEKLHIFFVHIGSSIKSDSQQLQGICFMEEHLRNKSTCQYDRRVLFLS